MTNHDELRKLCEAHKRDPFCLPLKNKVLEEVPKALPALLDEIAALRAENDALAACLRELLEDGFAKDGWEDDYEAARDKAAGLLKKRGE